jgi:hypothetical protein
MREHVYGADLFDRIPGCDEGGQLRDKRLRFAADVDERFGLKGDDLFERSGVHAASRRVEDDDVRARREAFGLFEHVAADERAVSFMPLRRAFSSAAATASATISMRVNFFRLPGRGNQRDRARAAVQVEDGLSAAGRIVHRFFVEQLRAARVRLKKENGDSLKSSPQIFSVR